MSLVLDIIGAITPKKVRQGLLIFLFILMIYDIHIAERIIARFFELIVHTRTEAITHTAQQAFDAIVPLLQNISHPSL